MRTLGPYIWNSLSEHIKAENNLIKFREYINQWFGPICKCNLCVYLNKKVRESYDYELEFDPFTENGFASSFSVRYVYTVFAYHSCN